MSYKIVVANWMHQEVLDYLRQHGDVVANMEKEPWPRSVLLDHCQDAEALVAFMPESIDEAFLAACPKLRIVACALKGFDNFDVAACTRYGVWLTILLNINPFRPGFKTLHNTTSPAHTHAHTNSF